jgi:hypothetical protein
MKHLLGLLFLVISYSNAFTLAPPVKGPAPSHLTVQPINSSSVKFSWQGNLRDYMYNLRYRQKGSGNWIYYSIEAPTTVRRVFNLVPGTWYEWQVQAAFSLNKRDTSCFVKGADFVTGIDCHTPEFLQASILDNNKVVFRWEVVNNNAIYIFRVREKGTEAWRSYQTTGNNLLLTDLNNGKIYEWDVSVLCDEKLNLYSANSAVKWIQMPDNTNTVDNWQLPIPMYENLSWIKDEDIDYVKFRLNENAAIKTKTASLINVMGERMMTLPVYYKSSSGEIAFDLSGDIPPGVYTVEFLNSSEQVSKTIVISSR